MALVSPYRWCLQPSARTSYAITKQPGGGTLRMHVLISGWADVDHANGNGLDNQRHNLRPASRSQQGGNRRKQQRTSSRYKGVYWCKERRHWRAYIRVAGQMRWLGRFADEGDAARAYDAAALAAWGEFARLNFPEGADGET
jgi:hypothetical protein